MRQRWKQWSMAAALLAGTTLAMADVDVQILTTDNRQITGKARWQAVQRQYLVEVRSEGGVPVQITLKPSDIKQLKARPPQGFDKMTRAEDLEKVFKEYLMLEHDIPAATRLMKIYADAKRHDDILRIGDAIKAERPAVEFAWLETAPAIWAAMVVKRPARLPELLDKAVSSPNRELAAMAAMRRGDLIASEGRSRDALKDGYLRVATLFKDVKTVQPEALYKAMIAFEELKQTPYADKMRQELLGKYGNSPYAALLGGGK